VEGLGWRDDSRGRFLDWVVQLNISVTLSEMASTGVIFALDWRLNSLQKGIWGVVLYGLDFDTPIIQSSLLQVHSELIDATVPCVSPPKSKALYINSVIAVFSYGATSDQSSCNAASVRKY
jgi:hypothetical protein